VKLGEIRPCGFRDMRADRQIGEQTFATLPGYNHAEFEKNDKDTYSRCIHFSDYL